MPIHRPEGARTYLLKSFASPPSDTTPTIPSASSPAKEESEDKESKSAPVKKEPKPKKKSSTDLILEKEQNLGLLLGALDLLFSSWKAKLGDDKKAREELDRKAWSAYVRVRPDVQDGVAGWGAKGNLALGDILRLR